MQGLCELHEQDMPVTMIRREKTVPNSIMRFCKVFYTDSKFSGIIKLKR